ncbi:MAG: T9SS type A sorting domain-containing protein [Bacteroidales bacterium]|nr:T9SS type A sorting domain-containing protein [Bacteroidales bacterium]
MMKKLTNLFLGTFTCLIATISLQAQPTVNVNWKAVGPDNISGRSNTVLIDRQNSNRIFAGSAGGGLWISTNGGTTWNRATKLEAVSVNALTQDENGTIYIGTGEATTSPAGVPAPFGVIQSGYTGSYYGIRGNGVYKMISTDSFALLEATADWKEVGRLAYDEVNHTLYAACDEGLQYSTDYGETWEFAKAEGSALKVSGVDVKACKGVVVFSDLDRTNRVSKAYLSTDGPDQFKSICGTNLITDKAYRIEMAIAPSDPNYIYASAIGTNGHLINFYLSEDKGKTFRIILPGGSTLIDLFQSGSEDNSLAVHPNNPKHILIGGSPYLWEGQDIQENTYYSFTRLVSNYGTNSIQFDPNDANTAFLATDLGIAKATFTDEIMVSYSSKRKNLATAQITSMSVGHNGALLAGSVENGTLYISTEGNTEQTATALTSPGYNAGNMLSVLNTSALYYSTSYGQCFRKASTSSDAVEAGGWYGGMMVSTSGSTKYPNWSYTIQKNNTYTHASLSPMVMWETTYDPDAKEKVVFTADKRYDQDDSICVKSKTANYPMWILAPIDMDTDDSTRAKGCEVTDFVQNRVFIGAGGYVADKRAYGASIFMAKGALDFTTPPTWYRVFFTLDTHENVTNLCISEDGNHLFATTHSKATGFHTVYRLSGFGTARDSATLTYGSSDGTSITINPSYKLDCQKIYATNTDFITSIYVNPYDNDKLVLTFSSGNIEMSENATTACDTVALVLNSKTGNGLPEGAFYTSLVLKCDADNANNTVTSDMAMVGTEEGVYYTENFNSTDPDWYAITNGIDSKVPVIKLIQQRQNTVDVESHYYAKSYIRDSAVIDTVIVPFPGVTNHGWVYAATYGRGIFCTDAFGVKGMKATESKARLASGGLRVYPNPTRDQANVSFTLQHEANINVSVYDLSGRRISSRNIGKCAAGENQVTIPCTSLSTGIYFVRIKGGENVQNGKMVIVK